MRTEVEKRHVDFGNMHKRQRLESWFDVALILDIYYIGRCVSDRELYVSSLV